MAQMVMGNECITSSGISESVGWQCTSTICLRTSFDGRGCIDVVSVKEGNKRNDSWYVTASQISLHATHQIYISTTPIESSTHRVYVLYFSVKAFAIPIPYSLHCSTDIRYGFFVFTSARYISAKASYRSRHLFHQQGAVPEDFAGRCSSNTSC